MLEGCRTWTRGGVAAAEPGLSRAGTCVLLLSWQSLQGRSGYIPDEGGWWDGEGLPMALAAPQGSVHDGDAAHTLLSVAASSPCSLASWPQWLSAGALASCLQFGLSWDPQRRLWTGHRPQDLLLLPVWAASISSQVGEGRSRL